MLSRKTIAVKIRKHDPQVLALVVDRLRADPLLTERKITKRELTQIRDGLVYDILRILTLSSYAKVKREVFSFLFEHNPFVLLHDSILKTFEDRRQLVDILRKIYSYEGDALVRPSEDTFKAIVESMRSLPADGSKTYHNEARCIIEYLRRVYEKFADDPEVKEDVISMLYLFVNSDEVCNLDLKNRALQLLFEMHVINYTYTITR